MYPVDGMIPDDDGLLFVNGSVWDSSELRFRKGELLLRGGMIENLSFAGSIPSFERSRAKMFDLEGGFLCPAFIDAHMHLLQWSITRSGVDLSMCNSVDDVSGKISNVVEGREKNFLYDRTGIVFGTGYDDSRFQEGRLDNGYFLEKEFGWVPTIIRRVCGHIALANSEGIGRLGLEQGDMGHSPIMEDIAMNLPWRLPIDLPTLSDLLRNAIDASYSVGVIGGVDIVPLSHFERMIEAISRTSRTLVMTYAMIRDDDRDLEGVVPLSSRNGVLSSEVNDDKMVPFAFEKFFLDGSIGARTASFSVDYTDSPSFPLVHEDNELKKRVTLSYDQGMVPMVHCIGDRAISQGVGILRSFGSPYRLEHAESIEISHLASMSKGKGALCLQPNFQFLWGGNDGLYERALGHHAKCLNPFRSVVDSKVQWCFGTDMMPPGPLFAMKGGLEHRDPRQRLSLNEMIKGFTINSARISLQDDHYCPELIVGSSPDMIVIDREMMRVNATMVKGQIVHVITQT
ncbi:MAG: amidohydrolase family protein [Candidatus Thermoplasmatota archaeon]|nr:amidohydrolase family protein [Candidatus Thermoplasmatota archaeon]